MVVVVVVLVVRRGVSRVVERVGRCAVRIVDVSLLPVPSCKLSKGGIDVGLDVGGTVELPVVVE